jgi:hypothetical protein
MSRNKLQGKYKGKRGGKHYRSLSKLTWYIKLNVYGNPFYSGRIKTL